MPATDPVWMRFGPSWRSEMEVVAKGIPERRTAFWLEVDPDPVIASEDPWRKPEAERFVPEAFVKLNLVATSRLVPEAFAKVNWLRIWVFVPPKVTLPVVDAEARVVFPVTSSRVEDTFEDDAFETTRVAMVPRMAERSVDETFEDEAVVATKVGVFRYPEAERLVPDAVVNVRSEVETFATPIEVPDAPVNWSWPART